jgi:hypothetical protein
MKGPYKVLK